MSLDEMLRMGYEEEGGGAMGRTTMIWGGWTRNEDHDKDNNEEGEDNDGGWMDKDEEGKGVEVE
jgi:hypothetical protein